MIKALLAIALFELVIFLFFINFKKKFQWLINTSDANPNFPKLLINKYNRFLFNKNLGWDNQKKSKNTEIIFKNQKISFEYNFDKKNGSRLTGNEFKNNNNIFFGDSYAFCRCSQDYETIQHYLEIKAKSKILNYGVGNYGLDQTLLKIKKTKLNNVKNIIILFVPETISRVHSYWKHFLEFGNILGFKPKYSIINGKLKLENNHVQKIKSRTIQSVINNLKSKDIFFKEKFLKNSFSFPYTFSFFRNFSKNFQIFFLLALKKLSNNNKFQEMAFGTIVKNNLCDSQKMYKYPYYNKLLEKIILEINSYINSKNKKCFFFVVPQLFDIKIYNKINFSEKFYKNISKKHDLKIYDLTTDIKNIKDVNKIYFDDYYGGHLNKIGNKLIARLIYNKIGNNL
jgi:hypothetical protein